MRVTCQGDESGSLPLALLASIVAAGLAIVLIATSLYSIYRAWPIF